MANDTDPAKQPAEGQTANVPTANVPTANVPTASAQAVERPVRPSGQRIWRWGITLGILVPFLGSAWRLEFSIARVAQAPASIARLMGAMFPLDFSIAGEAFIAVGESLFMAWVGTLLAAFFSFGFAFLAARNVTNHTLGGVTRFVLSSIRAFPELLLAILLIPITGLGPFTGTLAIGLHSIGTLGKLSSEVIEGIDTGPVEAIAAAGGNRFAQVRFGMVPQVLPQIVAYWLYRFEINVRASAVLGLIGAGGVGAKLSGFLAFRDLPAAGMVLFATVVTVLAIDLVSGRVRRRIIQGPSASQGQDHKDRGTLAGPTLPTKVPA